MWKCACILVVAAIFFASKINTDAHPVQTPEVRYGANIVKKCTYSYPNDPNQVGIIEEINPATVIPSEALPLYPIPPPYYPIPNPYPPGYYYRKDDESTDSNKKGS
ncbi:hypothetical protein WA026_003511 [Henosepilachna vigintioctopunctata]|uniref:Uncharacterized protein n=1 Tax=Henosepilachna vigintioctopunctata TaxID=420089 RepID=A0AAW1TIH2_9CUCU